MSSCYGTTPDRVAPTVALTKLDGSADGQLNEVASSGQANDGTTVRYDPSTAPPQHVYNLSTKRSQLCSPTPGAYCTNGDLTPGRTT